MNRIIALFVAVGFLAAGGCANSRFVEHYSTETPRFDPLTYFEGPTNAWGIVQNWRGEVVRRFQVTMEGTREDNELRLDEHFEYQDGERDQRTWRLTKGSDGTITGKAGDIEDTAIGMVSGNAMFWRYEMNLNVDESTYRVRFDDSLWQIDEATLFNRAQIKKFGVTVAEVTIFMQKPTTK